ncbi:rod-binding protein [uncultured Litoreibacter sp.]|uniref:rod-binding protein n=1 Tax=uncultured Litoreibacter sp. TaxID=1392394 RepID=UPI002639A910|nr:rod-binding protein [uncultured Litoreibacter sp.]
MEVSGLSAQAPINSDQLIRTAAKELEAVFLAEMLKAAGFGKQSESFGGGMGEDQFSSFLIEQQAKNLAQGGGVGLAEHIFHAMKGQ